MSTSRSSRKSSRVGGRATAEKELPRCLHACHARAGTQFWRQGLHVFVRENTGVAYCRGSPATVVNFSRKFRCCWLCLRVYSRRCVLQGLTSSVDVGALADKITQ
jgi:hypothetical protein